MKAEKLESFSVKVRSNFLYLLSSAKEWIAQIEQQIKLTGASSSRIVSWKPWYKPIDINHTSKHF